MQTQGRFVRYDRQTFKKIGSELSRGCYATCRNIRYVSILRTSSLLRIRKVVRTRREAGGRYRVRSTR